MRNCSRRNVLRSHFQAANGSDGSATGSAGGRRGGRSLPTYSPRLGVRNGRYCRCLREAKRRAWLSKRPAPAAVDEADRWRTGGLSSVRGPSATGAAGMWSPTEFDDVGDGSSSSDGWRRARRTRHARAADHDRELLIAVLREAEHGAHVEPVLPVRQSIRPSRRRRGPHPASGDSAHVGGQAERAHPLERQHRVCTFYSSAPIRRMSTLVT